MTRPLSQTVNCLIALLSSVASFSLLTTTCSMRHTRQAAGVEFAGVVYAHPLKISIGECMNNLQLIAEAADPEDVRNLVTYLPFR